MRVAAWIAAVLLPLGGFAWWASQRPEIRALFESTPSPENPLEFLETLPEIGDPVEPPSPPAARRPQPGVVVPAPIGEDRPLPEPVNQVPNEEVARVLMQILAARNLAADLSISVSDEEVAVHGEVASPAHRSELLDIIDRGREARRINTEHLRVRADE